MKRTSRPVTLPKPVRDGKSDEEFDAEVEGFCRLAGKELLTLTNEVEELQRAFKLVKDKVDSIKTGRA